MNRPHSRYKQVYAIVRWDPEMPEPEHQVAVPKVYPTEEAAEIEADRLNTVNAGKGVQYRVYLSHFVETKGEVTRE